MDDVIQQRSDTVEEDDMMHSNMLDDETDQLAVPVEEAPKPIEQVT